MKRFLFLLALVLCMVVPDTALAQSQRVYTWTYRNVKYQNLLSDQIGVYYCKVIGLEDPSADFRSTTISIPSTVSYAPIAGMKANTYNVIEIGDEAFANTLLGKVTYPESLVKVGNRAFYNSTLTEFAAPAPTRQNPNPNTRLAQIGDEAFRSTQITTLYLPKHVETYGTSVTADCPNFEKFILHESNDNFFVDYQGLLYNKSLSTLVDTPKKIDFVRVGNLTTTISEGAFAGSKVSDVMLPEFIYELGAEAFMGCYNLNELYLPNNNLTEIGPRCFSRTAIRHLMIPIRVQKVEEGMFEESPCLESVVFDGVLSEIGSSAFKSCPKLKYIEMGATSTPVTLGSNVFDGTYTPIAYVNKSCLSSLRNNQNWSLVKLEESRCASYSTYERIVCYVSDSHTMELTMGRITENLWDVIGQTNKTFPETAKLYFDDKTYPLTGVSPNALCDPQENVSAFFFPDGYKYIHGFPFLNSPVQYISLPASLEFLEEGFTRRALNLQKVSIDASNPRYGNPLLSSGRQQQSMVVDKKRQILMSVCADPYSPDYLEVPEGIRIVGNYSMSYCKANVLVLPTTVKEMGQECLRYSSFNKIICRAVTPPYCSTLMMSYDEYANVVVYVPSESITLYKSDAEWSKFNIQPIAEELVTIDGITYRLNLDDHTATVMKGDPQLLNGDVVIPDQVDHNGMTFSVTAINEFAFEDCGHMTSLTLSKNITEIGKGFVLGCYSLQSFNPNDNPYYTLNHSGALVNRVERLFVAMPAAKELELFIPEDDEWTFMPYSMAYCNVKRAYFYGYDHAYTLGDYMFLGCDQLTEVQFSECGVSQAALGEGMLMRTGIQRLDLPRYYKIIPAKLCYECINLKHVNLLGAVESIGDQAFYGCPIIESFEMPKVEKALPIGSEMFSPEMFLGGPKLYLPYFTHYSYYSLEYWNSFDINVHTGSFRDQDMNNYNIISMHLHEVELLDVNPDLNVGVLPLTNEVATPEGELFKLTKIGYFSMYNNKFIKELTIPESVTWLGQGAFAGSSLAKITLGSGVKYIEADVFMNMPELHTIQSSGNEHFHNLMDQNTWLFDQSVLYDADRNALLRVAPQRHLSLFRSEADIDFFEIPEGTLRVEAHAFENSLLRQVNFATTIESTGYNIMSMMPLIEYVYLPNNANDWIYKNYYIFGEIPGGDEHAKITVAIRDEDVVRYNRVGGWASADYINLVRNINGVNYELQTQSLEWLPMATLVRCESSVSGDLDIQEELDVDGMTYYVSHVRSGAFRNCSNLLSVTIPSRVYDINSFLFEGDFSLQKVTFMNSNYLRLHHKCFDLCYSLSDIYLHGINLSGTDYADALGEVAMTCNIHTQPLTNTLLESTPLAQKFYELYPESRQIVPDVNDYHKCYLSIDPRPMYLDYENGQERVKSENQLTIRMHCDQPVTDVQFFVDNLTTVYTDNQTRQVYNDWREAEFEGCERTTPVFAINPELEALGYGYDLQRDDYGDFVRWYIHLHQGSGDPVSLDGMKLCDLNIGNDGDEDDYTNHIERDYIYLEGIAFSNTYKNHWPLADYLVPVSYQVPEVSPSEPIVDAVTKMDVNTDGRVDVGDIITIQNRIAGKRTHFNPALAPHFSNEKLQQCIEMMRGAIMYQ